MRGGGGKKEWGGFSSREVVSRRRGRAWPCRAMFQKPTRTDSDTQTRTHTRVRVLLLFSQRWSGLSSRLSLFLPFVDLGVERVLPFLCREEKRGTVSNRNSLNFPPLGSGLICHLVSRYIIKKKKKEEEECVIHSLNRLTLQVTQTYKP